MLGEFFFGGVSSQMCRWGTVKQGSEAGAHRKNFKDHIH